ncbi:TetR/AcrR family transcriptional regulator [Lapidilactobacillus mulanensis]|uniref:TetR/AcrR family transcriptional regulator n=1 Tax=Lapidilactobacillus mulanensis TaxID=2485999 RepID=A0ABW4DP06_9LACO|nr:TetR/AcrR family transcriptional regulator [Lapidilactobacillus mulanensis]
MAQASDLKLFQDAQALENFTDKQIRILIAAIDIFSEKGYANASTKEIADQAGVSEGNIFSKFGNKQGLLDAIIEPVVSMVFPQTIASLLDVETNRTPVSLHAFISDFMINRMRFLVENKKVLKIFIAELAYNQETRTHYMQSLPTSFLKDLKSQLNTMKRNHMIVNWNNDEIMRLIWSVIGGAVIDYLFFDRPIAKIEVTHMIDALVRALSR